MTLTKVERQILENQFWIIKSMRETEGTAQKVMLKCMQNKTSDLLSQEKSEEPYCEMPEEISKEECDFVRLQDKKLKEFVKSKDGEEEK